MSIYFKNLYEVSVKRKNVCCIKNNVTYVKWAFPTAKAGYNPTYAEKINKSVLKDILTETKNYKSVLLTPLPDLDKKYSNELEFSEKSVVYGLDRKDLFSIDKKLTFKTVQTKDDLLLWGSVASQIYTHCDTDFIYESFKTDIGKKYATYFIFYKGNKPVGVSQVIRSAGCSAVYWIGVLDKYRKQGYGTEITKQTLNYEIANKRYQFVLTASELGLIIYKKLGFTPQETLYEYNLKR